MKPPGVLLIKVFPRKPITNVITGESFLKRFQFVLILILAVLLNGAHPAQALQSDFMTCWVEDEAPYTLWRKAGRGISNILLGWTELIFQPLYMYEEGNRTPIAITGGIVKGIYFTVMRTGAGVYELVTFPFPLPPGYKPFILPEVAIPRHCLEQSAIQ